LRLRFRMRYAWLVLIVAAALAALFCLTVRNTSAQAKAVADEIASACGIQVDVRACYARRISELIPYDVSVAFATIAILHERGLLDACHYLLHPIGEAAYERYAKTGDTSFMLPEAALCNYGFYHGFIIKLLEDDPGIATTRAFCDSLKPTLLERRPDVRDQCYHGVGHGLLDITIGSVGSIDDPAWVRSTLGRSTPIALQQCALLGETAENDCISGVFHESAMLQEERRWYTDPRDPLWLCRESAEEYQPRCFGNMDRLFFKVYPSLAARDVVVRVQELYGNDERIVRNVVRRFASRAAMREPDIQEVIGYCREIPDQYQEFCLEGAIAGIVEEGVAGEEYRLGLSFCSAPELSPAEKDACVEYAFTYFSGIYPASKMRSLCAKYEELRPQRCGISVPRGFLGSLAANPVRR